jgi:hypothetical protein
MLQDLEKRLTTQQSKSGEDVTIEVRNLDENSESSETSKKQVKKTKQPVAKRPNIFEKLKDKKSPREKASKVVRIYFLFLTPSISAIG